MQVHAQEDESDIVLLHKIEVAGVFELLHAGIRICPCILVVGINISFLQSQGKNIHIAKGVNLQGIEFRGSSLPIGILLEVNHACAKICLGDVEGTIAYTLTFIGVFRGLIHLLPDMPGQDGISSKLQVQPGVGLIQLEDHRPVFHGNIVHRLLHPARRRIIFCQIAKGELHIIRRQLLAVAPVQVVIDDELPNRSVF